jgi:hypothetical protein
MTIDEFITKWGTRTASVMLRHLASKLDKPDKEAVEELADDLQAMLDGDWGR